MPLDRHPHHDIRWLLVALAASTLLLGGCSHFGRNKEEKAMKGSPESIYREARKDLRTGNYAGSITKYEALEARYPFSEQAKQGQLDLLYAYYKNHALESAIDQADQFIRENPAHPRVDYAWYVKGLVYFESGANALERFFRADITKRPPGEIRKSLQSFQTLLQQYPKSPYAADSRQRVIYLRNRLADYELRVARYYMKRGAYVGAASRARGIVEQYDGAPSVDEALQIMAQAYRKLGIHDLAAQAERVRAANAAPQSVESAMAGGAGPAAATAGAGMATGAPSGSIEVRKPGHWEVTAGASFSNSSKVDFEGGTRADISSSTGFLLGVNYHLTSKIDLGGHLAYDRKDYTADIAGDQAGEVFPVKGTLDTTSLMVDAGYNFLSGPLTPFVTGSLGWNWVDTNIATAPPQVGCWWDPWYGYVCYGFQDTKKFSSLTYGIGLGVRWDFTQALFARGGYNMQWTDLGKAKGTPDFDGFQLLVGWRF